MYLRKLFSIFFLYIKMYFDLVRYFNVGIYKDRILLDGLEYDLYGNWIRSGNLFIVSI
jgi:hypothetical protein